MKEVSYEGYVILIRENVNENQQLVINSDANDYWVHISSYPSANAVIQALILLSATLLMLDFITMLSSELVVLSSPRTTNVNLFPYCNLTFVPYLISSQQIQQA